MGMKETFKAIGDPVRREILELLKGGMMSAGDIASHFDMTQATVSYHLSQLKKGGAHIREPGKELYILSA